MTFRTWSKKICALCRNLHGKKTTRSR